MIPRVVMAPVRVLQRIFPITSHTSNVSLLYERKQFYQFFFFFDVLIPNILYKTRSKTTAFFRSGVRLHSFSMG